jgi:hypothetical protein
MGSMKFAFCSSIFLVLLNHSSAANDYVMKRYDCTSLDESRILLKCGNSEKFISLKATFVRPLTQLVVRLYFDSVLRLVKSSCSLNSIASKRKTERKKASSKLDSWTGVCLCLARSKLQF